MKASFVCKTCFFLMLFCLIHDFAALYASFSMYLLKIPSRNKCYVCVLLQLFNPVVYSVNKPYEQKIVSIKYLVSKEN